MEEKRSDPRLLTLLKLSSVEYSQLLFKKKKICLGHCLYKD